MMKKILIVEDSEDSMEIMARTFEEDYLVIKATNGKEGLEKAIEEKPDIILMDVSLPIMDGLTVTKRIRGIHGIENTPIIIVSASAMAHDIEEALKSGCNHFLPKPVRPSLLRKKVAEYLLV
ncbi:MAG: response regulator [Chlamydiae bacterium]|nr:response regulator [Chlamydiota bacterium]MBI3276860.1 response regulator [Chlamydiota bacterium]